MKYILLTQRVEIDAKTGERRDALDQKWSELALALGCQPLAVSSQLKDAKKFISGISEIGAVFLTGGNNLAYLKTKDIAPERDRLESALLDISLKERIPVIGFCRGMQTIGYHFGVKTKESCGHVRVRHKLTANKDSRYYDELKKIKTANSFHCYNLPAVPRDFIISMKDEEGSIEAMESVKHPVFAMMWHPEREKPFRACDLNLIRKIIK